MSNKITIEINPLAIPDLLEGSEIIIKRHKNNIEYFLHAQNPVPENHKKIGERETKLLNILSEAKEDMQKAYDEYLAFNNKEDN